jgi:predicted CoA-binding protein
MQDIKDAASEFLTRKRVAVTGVSRTPKTHGSNNVYRRLRERGYDVFAVNPNADEVEGDRCYKDLRSIPDGVEAVVIGTRPELAEDTMHECAELGIKHVWMHRGPGAGSVSAAATDYGRQHGITVIDGGCPLMFGPPPISGTRSCASCTPGTCRGRCEPTAPHARVRANAWPANLQDVGAREYARSTDLVQAPALELPTVSQVTHRTHRSCLARLL